MIKLAFRKLFRKGEYITARIISLAIGLAFGLILLGEVLYYYSFDNCYPDLDNIYTVVEKFKRDKQKDEMETSPRISGAIAPGLQSEVPGVEFATRLNHFASTDFFTSDQKKYHARFSFADAYWQDVLPRPMIMGDAREILTTPLQCMISDELAEKIGGDVIGKSIRLQGYPQTALTIAGIFERLPENTSYKYDVLVSMITTSKFIWDGSSNWLGNDRYYTCVKLKDGVKPESMASAVRKMQEKHQDIEEIERKNPGFVFKYDFIKNKDIMHNKYKSIILILSIIAFSVIFVALMNYILLTVSTLVNRAKNAAVHKCYGAREHNIRAMIFTEAILVFIISLIITGIIIYLVKPFVEGQVGHKISSMFSQEVLLPLSGLLAIVLLVIGYVPGHFFAKIPVAVVFRNYRPKGNRWKLALLSLQFIGASFILGMLVVVSLQYHKMQNANHGYQTRNVYYVSTAGMQRNKISTVMDELDKLPEVEVVGIGETLPLYGASGNNIFSDDGERELFNIADFYYIDENYTRVLGLNIVEGNHFTSENNKKGDILISKSGAEKLIAYNKWAGSVVGKGICVTEHHRKGEKANISGVFSDFIIGSIANTDHRPAVFFYTPQSQYIELLTKNSAYKCNILIRTSEQHSSDIMSKLVDIVNIASPRKDIEVFSLDEKKRRAYQAEKGFRNTMLIGNGIILLITIIGLLGYTLSEVNRRRKELAIRKINGATVSTVLNLFFWDMQRMAIPAVLLGTIGSWFVADKWMQNFSDKITLNWLLFFVCAFAILCFVGIIAIASYWKSAKSNPVEDLRYE